jgi:hypothetical protein
MDYQIQRGDQKFGPYSLAELQRRLFRPVHSVRMEPSRPAASDSCLSQSLSSFRASRSALRVRKPYAAATRVPW